MKQLFYLGWWFIRARFFGRKKPLQTVLFITDKCNLSCKHCSIFNNREYVMKSYEKIREELLYSYNQSSRFVDFEGGEPTLWHDNGKDVNDLVVLAKKIGFFSCTITTNGQRPFPGSKADSIWVSMDGTYKYHDDIRGEGTFAKLEKNIAESGHRNINVNMTVNTHNAVNVAETIRYVQNNPHIKLISIGFHTPFPGTEYLFLDLKSRADLIDRIIDMKRRGYPIMNSVSGLKLMKNLKFKKTCWVSNFILQDGVKLTECPGKTAGICEKCGFSMAGEMRAVFNFKPDTLFAGMRLRL